MFSEKVSIIMRTKDVSNIIDQTLKALFSQSFKNFDLIIVDSDSSDDTLEKCLKYEHKLMVFTSSDYHPGKVLNSAINKCTTNVVVFLNSDCVMLLPNSLQILLNELEEEKTSAVFARQICRPEALSWVQRDYDVSFPNNTNPSWMHFSLPLAAIRKSVWKQIPFYTQAWASEDTKWAVDIKSQGHIVKYVKNSLVMHSHNYDFQQMSNRKYVEGEADAFIYNKKITLIRTLRNYIGSVYNDLIFHTKKLDFSGFFKSLVLRAVLHYSYLKGNIFGMKRKESNDLKQTYGNYQQG